MDKGGLDSSTPFCYTWFMERNKTFSKKELENLLDSLETGLEKRTKPYQIALILLDSLQFGPNMEKIMQHLELTDKVRCNVIERRLRENFIWHGEFVHHSYAEDNLALLLDVLVVLGRWKRRWNSHGKSGAVKKPTGERWRRNKRLGYEK